jgi:DNA-binding SARP family transcriptional activator
MQHMHSGSPIRLATEQLRTPAAGSGPCGAAAARLEIRVLGEFTVLRDGVPVPLPPSRKTRALLAYLAIDRRKHQRERLCELFWELPDDPRGALRWSLSRIRRVLGAQAESCLKADRNTVQLCLESGSFDHAGLRELAQADLDACPLAVLESSAARFGGPFLADLSLPRCPEFEAWRAAMCDETDVLHIRLLRALIERLSAEPERALPYAHRLRRLSPDNQSLGKEIEALARAARQSAMTQSSPRALRVAGAHLVAWEPRRERGSETVGKSQVLTLHRNLRPPA